MFGRVTLTFDGIFHSPSLTTKYAIGEIKTIRYLKYTDQNV